MIFVTVGTHEQPFNRLIEKIDQLKSSGIIDEQVIIQKGYSTYVPKACEYKDFYPWEEVQKLNKKARIIITHGGPASFVDILSLHKKPIIVPRQEKFNEHINNHQLEFSNELFKRGFPIIVVDDINDLENAIKTYNDNEKVNFTSNTDDFVNKFENEIKELFE